MRRVASESIARSRNNFGVLCGLVVQGPCFVSGHDFSRAAIARKYFVLLAPATAKSARNSNGKSAGAKESA
jgi:hypothetical protein